MAEEPSIAFSRAPLTARSIAIVVVVVIVVVIAGSYLLLYPGPSSDVRVQSVDCISYKAWAGCSVTMLNVGNGEVNVVNCHLMIAGVGRDGYALGAPGYFNPGDTAVFGCFFPVNAPPLNGSATSGYFVLYDHHTVPFDGFIIRNTTFG